MILVPRTASDITGNKVPQNTAKHMTTKTILLNKNPLSRDVKDSILRLDLSSSRLVYIIPKEDTRIKKTKVRKIGPNDDAVNEWTELITPERVKKVPKIHRVNVRIINTIFQIRNISFFSWIIMEWRNAVAVSHGIKLAFSTGSQAQ